MVDIFVILILSILAGLALYSCLKGGSGEGGSCGCGCGKCGGSCRRDKE